jgi:hypothetical protein
VDERDEPQSKYFDAAVPDKYVVGQDVAYETDARRNDPAYWAIRGREQQLIDSHGRARSDTGKPYKTENKERGVGKDNKQGLKYHLAANAVWKELHPYTGR